MGYVLRMSGEIRDWLAGLRDGEPRTAAAIVHALIALAREGPSLGPSMVVALDQPPPRMDPREALDYAYQERLERLHEVRRSEAERALSGRPLAAGQYASIQAEADAFRIRKEILKARYTSAEAQEAISRLIADADAAEEEDEQAMAHHRQTAAEQAEQIS